MKIKDNKKLLVRVSFILIIMLSLSFIYMVPKAAKADNIVNYSDEIRILEIEPANDYILRDENESVNEDGEVKKEITFITENDVTTKAAVSIHTVTMPQFISMVDEINGDYDVVVIGRKNDSINQDNKTTGGYLKYSDYTEPFKEEMKRDFLPLGSWVKKLPLYSSIDNKIMTEYYPENDITDKNAQKIIGMIDSGQLVYFDNTIIDDSLKNTKIYKNFSNIEGENFKRFNSDEAKENHIKDLTLETIVQDYLNLDISKKRPKVTSIGKPSDDSNSESGIYDNRKMSFNVSLDSSMNEDLELVLYLDINGDGIFKDNEIADKSTAKAVEGSNVFNINYRLSNDFIGYLDWKIEVRRANGVKFNIKNNSLYRALNNNKRKINVLQVCPDGVMDDKKFNLSKNKEFLKRIGKADSWNNTREIADYDININTISVSEFNKSINEGALKLNGTYDMLILGFEDSYGRAQIEEEACNEIEKFIETGQSVMFTHDTITPALSYEDSVNSYVSGPKLLTQRMRDYAGQARYADPYRLKENGIFDESDIYKEYVKADNDDGTSNIELRKKTIPHDVFSEKYEGRDVYTLGATQDGYIKEVLSNGFTVAWDFVTNVKSINSAQINNYPYKLNNKISVAKTHTQWYQLNFEDPDVVPWFNLTDGNFNDFDSRNFYYTYSKGNITYSGTGHSNGFTDEELKLFVNTIVKAERGANHAPEIECSIQKENLGNESDVNNVIAGSDYIFTVDARDFDGDPVELKVSINEENLTEENVDIGRLEERACFMTKEDTYGSELESRVFHVDSQNTDRKALEIRIPKNKLIKGNKICVEINAQDYRGARSFKKYTLNPIELPDFNIEVKLDGDKLRKEQNSLNSDKINYNTIQVEPGEIVDVPYDVKPNELEYGEVRETPRKEVAILVDLSMESSNLRSQCLNGLTNELINNKAIIGNTQDKDTRFAIFGYSSEKAERVTTDAPWNNLYSEKIRLETLEIMNNTSRYPTDTGSDEPKLKDGLLMADAFFKENNWSDSSKDIIIIANRDVSENSVEEVKDKIKNNYNVITLDISEDCYDRANDVSLSKEEHLQLLNRHKNIRKIHTILGGIDKDYFISRRDSQNDSVHNDLNDGRNIFKKIALSIGHIKYPTFLLDNLSVNFNIGNDINHEGGLTKKSNNDLDNNYYVNLPNIKYAAKMTNENLPYKSNGKLIYEGYFVHDNFEDENNEYRFEFKISAKDNGQDKSEFGGPNELTYNYSCYDTSGKGRVDKTPVLIINSGYLDHGIYKGIDKLQKKAEFINDSGTFASGSAVTCASNIMEMRRGTKLTIEVASGNDDVEFIKIPEIYKINSDGDWIKIGTYSTITENKKYEIDFNGASEHNIVVLYTVKVDSTVTINSKADKKEANVILRAGGQLPDLF